MERIIVDAVKEEEEKKGFQIPGEKVVTATGR